MTGKPYITIQIPNLARIQAAYAQAPSRVKQVLPGAINRALLTIGKKAAMNSPVRTGNLRSSILDPNRGLELASPTSFSGSVGSGTNYGLFVEMGTRFMRAQPFLMPAVDSSKDEIKQIFVQAIQGVLNNAARSSR